MGYPTIASGSIKGCLKEVDRVVQLQKLTIADFLTWENDQPGRNKFLRRAIFAMVGGQRGHGRIIGNLVRHFGDQLDGSPCRVFSESMKVQVKNDAVLYPDAFVPCDRAFDAKQLVFTQPVLVIEFLSPSTQAYDRSLKFAIYRSLASLNEYVLIDTATLRVKVFRLGDDGLWNLFEMSELSDSNET